MGSTTRKTPEVNSVTSARLGHSPKRGGSEMTNAEIIEKIMNRWGFDNTAARYSTFKEMLNEALNMQRKEFIKEMDNYTDFIWKHPLADGSDMKSVHIFVNDLKKKLSEDDGKHEE
jgi:hypothetical protein